MDDIDAYILELLQTGRIRAVRDADGTIATRPDDAGRSSIVFVFSEGAPVDHERINIEVEAYQAEIASHVSIAVPIPCPMTPSGCTEWPVVDWATDADGQRLPVAPADYGPNPELIAWTGLYAVQEEDGWWCFPDGARCDDKHLARAMRRRAGISIKSWETQSREVAAMDQSWLTTH